ncbi:LamG-like jellyroll fold domain-containing protein [Azospirillum sp.]|uniref:LamG-like jellyroll fold domain-containing protein n=1 Tax=Azospirillum sp. TaxID=34012 RepID=UPI003D73B6B7
MTDYQVTDDRTSHLNLALPHKDNKLEDDIHRLRGAVGDLDAHAQLVDEDLAAKDEAIGTLQGAVETLQVNAGIKVSPADTTPGTLDIKLAAGTNITLTKVNAGGNEQYRIDGQGGATINQSAPAYVVSGQTTTITGSSILAVYEQFAGQAFNLDFNTRAQYVEQDAVNGTDSTGGTFVLHNTAGAVIDSNTKLLIHADGANGSTEIVDERGITPFGTHCMYFQDESYFNIPKSYKMAFGTTQDFTIETWVRLEAAPANNEGYVFDLRDANTGDARGVAYLSYNYGTSKFLTNGAAGMVASATSAAQVWHHVAIVRYNGTRTLYVDGVSVGSAADTTNYTNSQIWLGRMATSGPNGYSLNGWLSNFHVSKKARYTANFTRPTAEFTRDADTVYLFKGYDGHGSQLIRDDSRSGHEVTFGSNSSVSTAQSKFGASSAVSSATSSGLSVQLSKGHADLQVGSDDATVDFWFRHTSGDGLVLLRGGTTAWAPLLYLSGGNITLYLSSNGSSWNIANGLVLDAFTTATWTHVALTRSGSSVYAFVNGVLKQTLAVSTGSLQWGATWYFGVEYNGSGGFAGHLDEIRVKRGECAWNATFTPPTSPYTTDDRTILLLHFDGANGDKVTLDSSESSYGNNGFGDTTIPILTFQNSAALSSAQTRGGHGTSLALNGTNQYTIAQFATPSAGHPIYFAPGEQFCIEGWFYIVNPAASSQMLFSIDSNVGATGTTSIFVQTNNTNSIASFRVATASANGGANFIAGWNHVALVREPRGYVLYVNGTGGSPVNPEVNPSYAAQAYNLWLGNAGIGSFYLNGAVDSVRITHGKPRYQANFTPGNLTQDDDTALLWVFDGSVGQKWVKELSKNTALTQATNARTVKDGVWIAPASTSGTITTTSPKFGTGAVAFSGGGAQFISIPDASIPKMTTANWVVDFWVNAATGHYILSKGVAATGSGIVINYDSGTTSIRANVSSNGSTWDMLNDVALLTGVTFNTWHHIAIVRSGTSLYAYLDGVRGPILSIPSAIYDNTNAWVVGRIGGKMDEIRFSVGTDRGWTGSTITVPTLAYGQQYVTGPYYVTTSNTSRIDVSAFTSIDNVAVAETINPSTAIKYAVSFDGRTTWYGKNPVAYPTDLTNAVWVLAGNATMTPAASVAAPDGTATAALLTDADTANNGRVTQTITLPADTLTRTFSMYVKAGTSQNCRFTFTAGNSLVSYLNFATGTVTNTTANTMTATAVGGGWYRVTGSVTNTASATCTLSVMIATGNGVGDVTQTGTLYLWHPRIDIGGSASAVDLPAGMANLGSLSAANLDTFGLTSAEMAATNGLLGWSPTLGTAIDIAASLKTANQSFTPILDNVTVTMDEYQMLTPGLDYTVKRKKATGAQTLTFIRVKGGNAQHVFDYVA